MANTSLNMYESVMPEYPPLLDDDDAEDKALALAIAESDADPVTVPHEAVREWLLRVSNGEFDAPLPLPR